MEARREVARAEKGRPSEPPDIGGRFLSAVRKKLEAVMSAKKGRVVRTPTEAEPYKVVLEHEVGKDTEHAVSTIREGEALIRSETPAPPERDSSYDRPRENGGKGSASKRRKLGVSYLSDAPPSIDD